MPPPNLTTLLSQLRAPIFNTLPVTSNARTGTKYLRRRLRGPSAVAYLPHMPSLRTLNRLVPWNKYAGWDGTPRPGNNSVQYHLPSEQVVFEGFEEVPRWPQPGTVNGQGGWLVSGKELVRFDDVARRRRMGKGPVKKGEGKRAQLGKGGKKK